MALFHFSLESVLRLKRGQERVERLKLEAIHSKHQLTRAKVEEMTRTYFESRRRFQIETAATVTGSELQFEAVRVEALIRARDALEESLVDLEQRRLAQMQVYTRVRQSRETFENLRDRKFELYRADEFRREQQLLDDLFLMRQRGAQEE
jgi:flagellar export protein FliJ